MLPPFRLLAFGQGLGEPPVCVRDTRPPCQCLAKRPWAWQSDATFGQRPRSRPPFLSLRLAFCV
jgi:hypothetical protein